MRGTAGYRLLLAAAAPLVFAHSLARSWRDGGWRYLRQRWGLGYPPKDPGLRRQWVHCASVGEVSAAAPLIARLSASGEPLLVTTSTPTGAAQLSRRFPDLPHVYLPLDYPVVLRRFLRHLRPARLLVVETEIWPCLYAVCHQARVPIVIVNARLSARTLEAPRWLRRAYADSLARVSAILARSDVDAERFVTLGAPSARVETCGNLKFSARPPLPVEPVVPDRHYLLAASTRDDEEALVLAAWRQAALGDALLVVAPRHPERRREILRLLADFRVAVRSQGAPVDADTEVYLVDTLGELPAFMAGARLVFMGGSLVPRGGHNLLEPAALGAPVIVGPHVDNFSEEFELLQAAAAVRQVPDEQALGEAIRVLWPDEATRRQMANAGQAVMARQAGVLESYMARLSEADTWRIPDKD